MCCQWQHLLKTIRLSGVSVHPVLHIFTEKNGDLQGDSEPAMRTVSGVSAGSLLSKSRGLDCQYKTAKVGLPHSASPHGPGLTVNVQCFSPVLCHFFYVYYGWERIERRRCDRALQWEGQQVTSKLPQQKSKPTCLHERNNDS